MQRNGQSMFQRTAKLPGGGSARGGKKFMREKERKKMNPSMITRD